MENSLKVLTMAAGIFITCVVISFSLLALREGKRLGSHFLNELREEERLYGESKWTRYEGALVSGAEVINAVRRFQKDIMIGVDNRMRENIYTKYNLFRLSDNVSHSAFYIEPFDDYVGSITRDGNGRIEGIWFLKRG